MYEHPRKLDYHNPVEIIYSVHGTDYRMRFATRDGDQGQQQLTTYSLTCVSTLKPDTEYSKIQVWYSSQLQGIRFFTKENVCVLQAGYCTGSQQEIALQPGERLLAIKSRLYENNNTSNTLHWDDTTQVQ